MRSVPSVPSVSVAFVRDWLTVYAGADRTMDAALELFPDAPIYALLYQAEHFHGTRIADRRVHTSMIDRLPRGRKNYHTYLPLMPLAIEQFDLNAYDIIISLSHTVAKGALTRSDQLHISYVFTPMRYAWDLCFPYLSQLHLTRGPRGALARLLMHYLRMWDVASASRPDVLIASSRCVARRIRKTYRRDAEVIYPPVDIDRFRPQLARDDFYLTVSRLVPYKRVDLIVETFNRLGLPLVVIGDGPERRKIERLAGHTVTVLGQQPDTVVQDHMERCRAFVFAADEDFGIVIVEDQAAGAPVIAYERGGATETVVPDETGLFFAEQNVECLAHAVGTFEASAARFHPERISLTTRRFSRERFKQSFALMIDREWRRFTREEHVAPSRIEH